MERQSDGDDKNDEYETTVVADSDEDDSQVILGTRTEPEPEPATPEKSQRSVL